MLRSCVVLVIVVAWTIPFFAVWYKDEFGAIPCLFTFLIVPMFPVFQFRDAMPYEIELSIARWLAPHALVPSGPFDPTQLPPKPKYSTDAHGWAAAPWMEHGGEACPHDEEARLLYRCNMHATHTHRARTLACRSVGGGRR